MLGSLKRWLTRHEQWVQFWLLQRPWHLFLGTDVTHWLLLFFTVFDEGTYWRTIKKIVITFNVFKKATFIHYLNVCHHLHLQWYCLARLSDYNQTPWRRSVFAAYANNFWVIRFLRQKPITQIKNFPTHSKLFEKKFVTRTFLSQPVCTAHLCFSLR